MGLGLKAEYYLIFGPNVNRQALVYSGSSCLARKLPSGSTQAKPPSRTLRKGHLNVRSWLVVLATCRDRFHKSALHCPVILFDLRRSRRFVRRRESKDDSQD